MKNWCFWTVVLEKTLEGPLDSKGIKPVCPRGNQPWIFFGRSNAEAEAPVLWLPDAKSRLTEKDPGARKEGKRRRGWQRIRWLDSITNSVDMNLSKLKETLEGRWGWHTAVHRVTKSQTRLSNWITTIFDSSLWYTIYIHPVDFISWIFPVSLPSYFKNFFSLGLIYA